MSDTTYVDFSAPAVSAAWLNDVNNVIYRGLTVNGVVPVTPAQVMANLGAAYAADIASVNSGLKGAGQVGYGILNAYASGTVGAELARTVWLDNFGADSTGAVDCSTAYNAAKTKYGEATVVRLTPGATYLFTQAIQIGDVGSAAAIVCDGYATFKFSGIGSTTDCFTLVGSAYRRQTITGLIINANGTGRDAVVLSNGDHPIFQRCIIQNSYRDAFVIYCLGTSWVENGHFELELDTCGRHAIRLQIDGTGGAFINECTWADIEVRGVSKVTAGGHAVYVTGTATTNGAQIEGHLWLKTNFDAQYNSAGSPPVPSLNVVENDAVITVNWRFMAGAWENTGGTSLNGGYAWAVTGSGQWGGLTIDSNIDNSQWGNLGANAAINGLTFADFSQGLVYSDSPILAGTRSYNSAGANLQTKNGVTFPATQVPSTDPNTLDDYKEVAWTPVLTNGTTNATSYYWQRGTARKIGNYVWCEIQLSINVLGIASGTVSITGLPYPLQSDPSLGSQTKTGVIGLITSSGTLVYCQIAQTSPTTLTLALASTPATPLPYTYFSATTTFFVQFGYVTTT